MQQCSKRKLVKQKKECCLGKTKVWVLACLYNCLAIPLHKLELILPSPCDPIITCQPLQGLPHNTSYALFDLYDVTGLCEYLKYADIFKLLKEGRKKIIKGRHVREQRKEGKANI